ncbi:MAG TPA: TIGR03620 family F420-dependent LLM class oxidoreductase [Pseudonocardiaceae bacterium]|jgi:probable F420-dependent oxidoreductase|nr:TIGR03620 family F420-dependent LLM class oxidoreductase [Pseudonocardiaceae bacterium]
MGTTGVVAAARRALGPIGVFMPFSMTEPVPIQRQRAGARRLEELGYRALWNNEGVGGKDSLLQLSLLLAATERMVVGSSIANIWARPPQTMHAGAAMLAEAYPGRFVLGIGVGYPSQAESVGQPWGSPLATLRDYLDRMHLPTQLPAPTTPYPRIVAANGPKMLALAGDVTDGALPTMVPAGFTAQARETLGPDKLLVVGLSVLSDGDQVRTRELARQFVSGRIERPGSPYAKSLIRAGFTETDLTELSDRLVDAVVAHGDPATIAARAGEHLAAGADHVVILPLVYDLTAFDQYERLAPALTALTTPS